MNHPELQAAGKAVMETMRSEPATDRRRPNRLRAVLRGDHRRMKRLYLARMAEPAEDKQPVSVWLCDNYYLLEKETKQTIRELKGYVKLPAAGRLPQLYRVVEAVLAARPALTQELMAELTEAMSGFRDLETAEFDFLPLAIRAALLRMACEACGREEGLEAISYAIPALTQAYEIDFDALAQAGSVTESILLRDPSGIYPNMEKESRSGYRALAARIARRTGRSERDVAEESLALAQQGEDERARHVGAYLLGHPALARENRWRRQLFLAGTPTVTVLLALLAGYLAGGLGVAGILTGCLAVLPLWEAVRPVIERIVMRGAPVRLVPRVNLDRLPPDAGETVVAVSVLMPPAGNAPKLARHLEDLYHSNPDNRLSFCLLADFKEKDTPAAPEDEGQAEALGEAVRRLNETYGDRFMLFVRGRRYSKTQRKFCGWERKRGAITELVRAVKGDTTTEYRFEGNRERLTRARYLLALDSDTNLLLDTARRMIAAALHPLNHAVIDESAGVVIKGYGIFAPRVATTLESQRRTAFSRVMAGIGGTNIYDAAGKDCYQDLFGEAIFCGKGLIDVDCYYRLLNTRFPENRVLSHDSLESAYLRTALLADVELSDSFPSSASAWLARLRRWIRGDWQNLRYIAGKSPLGALNRWKLLDNLRRSLTPVLTFACVAAAVFLPLEAAAALFWTVLLSTLTEPLLGAFSGALVAGMSLFSRKFFTRVAPQAIEHLARAAYALILLPQTAIGSLQAVWLALYRQWFSRRNLLQWVTAADSEGGSRWNNALRHFWPGAAAGFALLILSPYGFIRLYALLFASSVPFAALTARERRPDGAMLTLSEGERLNGYCAAMWRFYKVFAGEEDHYLPPDNVQQSPVFAVAHRTSPTNVGMLLLSTLAARDLSFIKTGELAARIERTVTTVERLEKWHGNLYNWYDTRTLALLEPSFVSMVDSGNFVCCLVALREGLAEYASESERIAPLLVRLQRLIDETDLTVFYNRRRNLFSIGYEPGKGALMDSCYDFFMSEARLASYYAVASRQAPKRHWGTLNRTMSQTGAYAGPVSWTGTMFEYYMPHLLLPVVENSLLEEALSYCMYCQRRRAREARTPWGISESAFYLFDGQLNYQYKAHGVQKLGVKRGLDEELVISPYSTFLALPFFPRAAMNNLRRMERMGLLAGYGFYEAVDFTSGRVATDYAVCRSFMAHHIGMSLVAACNALLDQRMQRRFMRDNRMNAARELLEEKVCRETVVYDNLKFKDTKERDPVKSVISEEYDQIFPQSPQATLLSNGMLQSLLTDTGASWLSGDGRCLTRRGEDLLTRAQGIFAFVQAGGHTFSLTQAPLYDNSVRYRVEFRPGGILYKAKHRGVKTGIRVLLHPALPCEQREYQVKNLSQQRISAQLLIYFEPVLAPYGDYSAHPAFSKLFVTAEYDAEARVLIYTRRERGGQGAVYLAAGFLEETPFEFETHKENLMPAPAGAEGLLRFADRTFTGGTGSPDAVCAMRLRLEIPAGGRTRVTQVTAMGTTREEAVSNLARMRAESRVSEENAPANPLLGDTIEGRLAFLLLPQLLFPCRDGRENDAARAENRLGREALWSLSISGDRPIVLFPVMGGMNPEQAAAYLRLFGKCHLAGMRFDLVFALEGEAAGEHRIRLEALADKLGCRDQIGDGIYPVDLSGREDLDILLRAAAVHIAPRAGARVRLPAREFAPVPFQPVAPAPRHHQPDDVTVEGGVFAGGRFYCARRTPLPFTHILSNPTFGTLTEDASLGFSWAVNARENKLTPWSNDIATGNTGERLVLRAQNRYFDLVRGSLASFSPDDARYEGVCDGIAVEVTVRVPRKGCVKEVRVKLHNLGGSPRAVTLAYYTEPVLGVDRREARQLNVALEEGALLVRNPFQTAVRGVMGLCCEGEEGKMVSSRAEFLCGRWDAPDPDALASDPCGALLVDAELAAHGWQERAFRLTWAANDTAAARLFTLPLDFTPRASFPRVATGDASFDVMVNGFLPHQTLACRVWGRTAFYQCGGAYGFRDQLQDVCACLPWEPDAAKYQILRAAAVQFEEGDALHWWHNLPQSGGGLRGVRTKYSDDFLWLPYAVCEYVGQTGDRALLDVSVPYLEGDLLGTEEKERYFQPVRGGKKATVYEHCVRALRHGFRLGEHGLPLIGCGDWNDGFNTVGIEGKGESVWLALFLALTQDRFAALARSCGDAPLAEQLADRSRALREAVDRHAWDGAWYLRAFYDDGTPMGSSHSAECRIDSLPQSFAVLGGMPDASRVDTALNSALGRLADPELELVRLFDPPFAASPQNPGYVKAYPAGLRENGGQYTHAAVWLALALLERGRAADGARLMRWLNPAHRCQNPDLAARYRLEPYYLAADLYTNPDAPGRGGWSMYTGAAGWYYRAATQSLLGLRVADGRLNLRPCLPPDWDGFSAEFTLQGTSVTIHARRGEAEALAVNGSPCDHVPLDGTPKTVELTLPR